MSALWLLLWTAGGVALVSLMDDEAPLPDRLAAGAVAGMVASALFGFVAAAALSGMAAGLVASALVPIALLVAAASQPRVRTALHGEVRAAWTAVRRPRALVEIAWGTALVALLARVFDRALYFESGGIATGDAHNLGDLPFHLAIVEGFHRGQNFWPEHPELAGVRLTYPFLADFSTALLLQGGVSLRNAVVHGDLVLGLALVVLLHGLTRALTGDRRAALVAPWLVLLSGGLGFLELRHDFVPEHGLLAALGNLPRDYTLMANEVYRWGNTTTTLLVPQRSILMGLPLALAVFGTWWRALESVDPARARRRLRLAGVLAGLLPLVHAHSFAVVAGMAVCLALLFPPWRRWLHFFVPALALGVPQALWLAHGASVRAESFLAWSVGWDHGEVPVAWFWFLNAGLFIPMLVLALLWPGARRPVSATARRFYAPFLLCFVVPNLLRMSPWVWDNIKFFVYWLALSAPLVAAVLARWSRGGGTARAAAVLVFVVLVASGGLDVWRVMSGGLGYPIFNIHGLVFAQEVARRTPPDTVLVQAATYDAPTLLSGRRSVLGYAGHIWSQGLDIGTRKEDVEALYGGGEAARDVIRRYRIGAIVVGPQENRMYEVDPAFVESLPILARVGSYTLRDARALAGSP